MQVHHGPGSVGATPPHLALAQLRRDLFFGQGGHGYAPPDVDAPAVVVANSLRKRGITSDAKSSSLRRVLSAGSVPSWNSPSRLPAPSRHRLSANFSNTVSGEPTMAYSPSTTWSQVSRLMANVLAPFSIDSIDLS